jgi:hypothetical protein
VRLAGALALAALLGFGAATARAATATPREVALVLDTSRSMVDNDPRRYGLQISQIVSDLLDDGDALTVVRMPRDGLLTFFAPIGCSDGATPNLALRSDGRARASFKSRLDQLVSYDTGTYFAAPIRTAIGALAGDRSRSRLLLVVADSGGLGPCDQTLTRELVALQRSGVTLAAINLGGDAGAFDHNPAFDLTASAGDAEELIAAVARVYQRFLGGRSVSTGVVKGQVAVEVAPYVRDAYVVFAADGPLGALAEGSGNPGAAQVDVDFRGGGGVLGLDGRRREYRIVHLARPNPGTWRFTASQLAAPAGWMLIQDSSLGLRLRSPSTVAAGFATTLEAQLVDEATGAAVTAPPPGLVVTAEVEGRTVTLRDDGAAADATAGDGIYSASVELQRLGRQQLSAHLASELLDRRRTLELEVIEGAWKLVVTSPAAGRAGVELELAVEAQPLGASARLVPPERVEAIVAGLTLALAPLPGGGRRYSTRWRPAEPGKLTVEYRALGGSPTVPANAPLTIAGVLELGRPRRVVLGPVGAGEEASAELTFPAANVRGSFTLEASSTFARRNVSLEIDPGSGWVPLGATPVTLQLDSSGRAVWPLRLRAASCPHGTRKEEPFTIAVRERGGASVAVPLAVAVVAEPWLACWWPALALVVAIAAVAVGIHGYTSPSRFAPRLGVWMSTEIDPAEGFFHPIRAARGTGSGFYRDATVYVCSDYRLSGRPRGAVARLRASGRGVRIRPIDGSALSRQRADGSWEPIPLEESTASVGTLYRIDRASLFFEARHG